MREYTISDFNIRTLGSIYQPDRTVFRVFAPEYENMELVIRNHAYQMHRNGFVFEIALGGDLELERYHYRNEKGLCFRDPFAYLSDENDSIVLNPDKFLKETIMPEECRDMIIYECNVRDFSSSPSFTGRYPRKFLAFTEEGLRYEGEAIGLDHLIDMGITHLQLMPVMDFDNDKTEYNWGYNPLAYNYVKKDYVYDQGDPYAYVNELRHMVNVLHSHNIRVVLDVVFNHVYSIHRFDLEKMLPGHVFRYMEDGKLAQGTMCGSEIRSEDVFVREYLKEMTLRYLELFDIDGIRMDLMGILDIETVNQIRSILSAFKRDFVVYGEGWDMGDVLPRELRASIPNARKLPEVAMFNDYFRDTMIHYVSGNRDIRSNVIKSLCCDMHYLAHNQSVNYVECHDDHTFFDRMMLYKSSDPRWINEKRCTLALSLVLLSRGIPFIHAGEEFYRTKNGVRNSYNSLDTINQLDWQLKVRNSENCRYIADLISFRKQHSCFTDDDADFRFEEFGDCLIYHLNDLMIFINPFENNYVFADGKNYEILFDEHGRCVRRSQSIEISAYSIVICRSDDV